MEKSEPYTVLAGGIWNGEKRALHCVGGWYMEWRKAGLTLYMDWRKTGLTLFLREVYGTEKRKAPDRRTQV